jgi:hypothetical protein
MQISARPLLFNRKIKRRQTPAVPNLTADSCLTQRFPQTHLGNGARRLLPVKIILVIGNKIKYSVCAN